MLFTRLSLLAAVSAVSLGAASAWAQVGGGGSIGEHMSSFDRNQRVELSEVPNAARDVAVRELGSPDVTATTQGYRRGDRLYEFESVDASGVHHSVTVTADGSVIQRQ